MLDHSWQYTPLIESKQLRDMNIMQGTTQYAWLLQQDTDWKLINVAETNQSKWNLGGNLYGCSAFSVAELHWILADEKFNIDMDKDDIHWTAEFRNKDQKLVTYGTTEAQTLATMIVAAQRSFDPFITSRLNSRIRKLFYTYNK